MSSKFLSKLVISNRLENELIWREIITKYLILLLKRYRDTNRTTMKNWQTVAAEELGESLDGASMKKAIEELRQVIAKEGKSNISYEDDDDFLVKFLRTCKLDTKRAFKMINNYYHNRATYSSKVK